MLKRRFKHIKVYNMDLIIRGKSIRFYAGKVVEWMEIDPYIEIKVTAPDVRDNIKKTEALVYNVLRRFGYNVVGIEKVKNAESSRGEGYQESKVYTLKLSKEEKVRHKMIDSEPETKSVKIAYPDGYKKDGIILELTQDIMMELARFKKSSRESANTTIRTIINKVDDGDTERK